MRSTLLSILFLIPMTSMAQERVILNGDKITTSREQAILVRTSATPETVRVTFQVPMSESICERYETRYVWVTSESQCGVDQRMTYNRQTVCTRRHPQTQQCLRSEVRMVPVVQRYPRSCQVPENYCARYGTITRFEADEVKIKFKNLPNLGGTEEDTFLVRARQRSYSGENVVYEITPLQTVAPYEVKSKGFMGMDSYVIKLK
jgi:hypothetical protein